MSKKDIWQKGQTVYKLEQSLRFGDELMPYDNGLHTLYVNAETDDGSNIAKLMQYLKTAKAGDTSQGALSEHVNYLKSPEGGRATMGEFEKICRTKEKLENIKAIMKNVNVSPQEAMTILEIPPEEQQKLLPLL